MATLYFNGKTRPEADIIHLLTAYYNKILSPLRCQDNFFASAFMTLRNSLSVKSCATPAQHFCLMKYWIRIDTSPKHSTTFKSHMLQQQPCALAQQHLVQSEMLKVKKTFVGQKANKQWCNKYCSNGHKTSEKRWAQEMNNTQAKKLTMFQTRVAGEL